jgi:hypothetical protein
LGRNTNNGANSGFIIQGRPQEFNNMIERDGQLVRLIHAKKCSGVQNGKAELFCTFCKGKGYNLFFQKEFDIYKENSPHGLFEQREINPFYIPITKVRLVQRRLNAAQCPANNGITNYNVESFTDTSIFLEEAENLPKRHERIEVSYSFRNSELITDENSNSNGTYKIKTIGTEYTGYHVPDVLDVHGDIIGVTRVYNVTQDYTYTVSSFKKNMITLDSDGGLAPTPLSTDTLEIDYEYVPVFYAVLLQVKTENAVEKWGEDVKVGDVRIVLPSYYHIDRFSIITAMTTILQTNHVIIRGSGTFDELPNFDVFEIIDNIEDEDGTVYTNSDFELQEFNNLVWTGTNKPAQGKKYSVKYSYRPSYKVYRDQSKTINLGRDGRYPIFTFARFFNKFSSKDWDKI